MKKTKLNRVPDRRPRTLTNDDLAKTTGGVGVVADASTVPETIKRLLDALSSI